MCPCVIALCSCRYFKGHPTIRLLWQVLHSFNLEQKKKFLFFCTGSDRAPIKGLGSMVFVVSRNGPDSERLPTRCSQMLVQVLYDCCLCALEFSHIDAVIPVSITFSCPSTPRCRACACEHAPAATFLFVPTLFACAVLMLE